MRINEQIEHYSSINLLYISTLVIAIGLEGVVSLSIYPVARMPILHSIGHSDKTRIKFFYKYGPKGLSCAYTKVQCIEPHSSFFLGIVTAEKRKQLDIYNRSTSTFFTVAYRKFLIIAYVKQEHGFYFHNRKLQRRDFLMPAGLALTVGLNSVDPKHYSGWSGELNACEADAEDMTSVVKSQGFKVTTLLTRDATRERVIEKIREASKTLKSGDIFMLSYSGHGGQLPDRNEDEADAMDETWCLYDGELVDDEMYSLYGEFAQGVRVLAFSDSCHSGTVTKVAYYQNKMNMRTSNLDMHAMKYRFMPSDVAQRTYRLNKEFYDKILKRADLKEVEDKVKASVLLISGCQDNQLSQDGNFNGLFTSQLLAVWKDGTFKGTYRKLHKYIVGRMPPDQTPNYYIVGQKDSRFERQRPFTV